MQQPDRTTPIMVSMGDPAGIGPEIIAKAWAARHERGLPPFVAVGDCRAIRQVWDGPVQIVTDLTRKVADHAQWSTDSGAIPRD